MDHEREAISCLGPWCGSEELSQPAPSSLLCSKKARPPRVPLTPSTESSQAVRYGISAAKEGHTQHVAQAGPVIVTSACDSSWNRAWESDWRQVSPDCSLRLFKQDLGWDTKAGQPRQDEFPCQLLRAVSLYPSPGPTCNTLTIFFNCVYTEYVLAFPCHYPFMTQLFILY